MNNIVYIDVREPAEYISGHVGGAANIPLGSISSNPPQLQAIAKDAQIVVYCRSGGRAQSAAQQLKAMGYTNVTNGTNQATIDDEASI